MNQLKVATILLVVALSLALGANALPPVCGAYGPLQWFNQGQTMVTTANLGSPLGLILGMPVLYGCTPKSADFGHAGAINFTYSSVNNLLVSKADGSRNTNFTASYEALSSKETVITAFDLVDDQSATLTYQSKAPFHLFNQTVMLDRQKTTISQIYSYTLEMYPNLVSEILFYDHGKIAGEFQFNYTYLTSETKLISQQFVKNSDNRGNSTTHFVFSYSTEHNLLNQVQFKNTMDNVTNVQKFTYDDKNRVVRMSDTRSNQDFQVAYDDNGNVASLFDARFGNVSFTN